MRVYGSSAWPPGVIDTDMQATIRASGINRISQIRQIRQIDLAPVGHPAAAILYLCTAAADDLVGKELALNDSVFRRRVGLVRRSSGQVETRALAGLPPFLWELWGRMHRECAPGNALR